MRSSYSRAPSLAPRSPMSGPIPVCPDKEFSPLVALSPYQSGWVIKVKVAKLYPIRRFTPKTEQQEASVFSALFVDDQTTEIEGTFWREAAEYYHEQLEEGKVYYFSNFGVKPANKRYAAVDFEYSLNFDSRTKVEEAINQDTTHMVPKVILTDFDDLHKFIDQPTLVSVSGVVTHVAATGTVKRKTDASELLRRDITLANGSSKSISLTLWSTLAQTLGDQLEELVVQNPPTVVAKHVRVNSFNGLSLASVARTAIEINPEIPEARQLQEWYELVGKTETIVPLSEGIPNPRLSMVGDEKKLLKDVDTETIPNLGDKATFSLVNCTVVFISPDQSMFYLANKENNRKVVEQDGKYYCEYNCKLYDEADWRYNVYMRISDFTKSCWVTAFNDQAEELLGISATSLEEMRRESEEEYKAYLTNRMFHSWSMKLKSEARENARSGEVELRHNIVSVRPTQTREEAQAILKEIKAYRAMQVADV